MSSWLQPVATFTVPETTESFVVADRFVVDISDQAKVRLSRVQFGFASRFGKMRIPIRPVTKMASFDLPFLTIDRQILYSLKEETPMALVSIAEIWELMRLQPNRTDEGVLLTNGAANLFYCLNHFIECYVVRVVWDLGGWVIDATNLNEIGWPPKRRVFASIPTP